MQVRSLAGDFYDAATGTLISTFAFTNPANSLTVNLGRGNDALSLGALDADFNPLSITVEGGEGDDALSGGDTANLWSISGEGSGFLNGYAFNSIELLTGGSEQDDFVFADGARISLVVDGGTGGSDTLDYSADTVGVSVFLGVDNINIDHVIGGIGADTLTGTTADSIWNITTTNCNHPV